MSPEGRAVGSKLHHLKGAICSADGEKVGIRLVLGAIGWLLAAYTVYAVVISLIHGTNPAWIALLALLLATLSVLLIRAASSPATDLVPAPFRALGPPTAHRWMITDRVKLWMDGFGFCIGLAGVTLGLLSHEGYYLAAGGVCVAIATGSMIHRRF
jgi:hypothetical protein